MSLYNSKESKKEIFNLYDQKLESLHVNYEYLTVSTSFGNTNIITCGEEKNPPIILLHGSNACAPIALETYQKLIPHFKVYAIDILAQPNKSDEIRLSMKDDSYGKWMHEIIDHLQIKNITLAGFSFAGLVILKTLEVDENKISKIYLSAPAYIVNGNPLKALFKIFIPMKKFIKSKNTKYLEKFLKEIFSEKDPFALEFMSKVLPNFNMDFTPVPTISKQRANSIKTPITLFAAEKDLMFPGKKMIQRAIKIFPSLKHYQLFKNSNHVLNNVNNNIVCDIIINDITKH
ncbi:alpha/beta hydrolase [Wenyingzhuangia sp. chi5]|uniref:Alpha/beta hydrolase n=1 Tax=Wenyingzhuangia gilva TaxID=3057677 RepID=A0ABT8VP63_9FLAO|nr:alpha/beta hydrolase [Wenyingzhuangia sp. chi5]MDO3693764.1 alpha/beta hydrolase [Wenyingzhuangia sp. chi5]